MNEYIVLMDKSIDALQKAIDFYNKKDYGMMTFWKNASVGYREKALNLTIGEVLK